MKSVVDMAPGITDEGCVFVEINGKTFRFKKWDIPDDELSVAARALRHDIDRCIIAEMLDRGTP